ncbi:MAG: acetylxylan esterase [Lentimicrobiaceae bacterium]|jgi:cephalosporin-C deacetylase-like acetyl esterase
MKQIILLISCITFYCTVSAQNLFPEKWKFKTGDNPEWASTAFDDSKWGEITPGIVWEQQGFPDYDGFAWYRVTFTIPSKFRKDAESYGGFSLQLGKIDDVDITCFNGGEIGKTGELPPDYSTKYDVSRVYTIPASKVHWDQPNTIAVRVFDFTGNGGIYGDPIQLSVHGIADKINIEPVFEHADRIFLGSGNVNLQLSLKNDLTKSLAGKLSVRIVSDFNKEISQVEKTITLKSRKSAILSFPVPGLEPGFYKAYVTFGNDMVTKKTSFMFGYEPEKIISPTNPQPDFANYWQRAKKELAAVDPQYKIIKIDSLCTAKRNIYLIEMRSLGNILIRGWYSVPTAPGKYPAVMQVQGYSSTIVPEYVNYGDDLIGFGLNIRGHGNSKDDVNPGFPGYLEYFLNDKELYIYRGAYMDCVRGIDFLFSRPEVDTTRVAVEGASQGGALTFATAALNNTRIRACAPQVPFLSDFKDYFQVATWPANEFVNYVEVEKKQTWDQVYNTLSYIDIKNLAPWIKAPMLMGAGLVDNVCPPHINFAAFNQVTSEKSYIVYPLSGHGLPEDFYNKKMDWIRTKFGMK